MKVLSTSLLLALCSLSEAKQAFEFGDPTYFGNGCPTGTAQIVPNDDGNSWSVLFSDFIAQTDGDDTFDRASCNLAVTLDMKPNKRMGVFKTEYRGYTYGPSDRSSSFSTLDAEWFFAGGTGEEKDRTFRTDDTGFYLSNRVRDEDVNYCECGDSTIFRINTAITAQKAAPSHFDVEIGVDSIDQTSARNTPTGYTFYVYIEDC